MLTIYVPINIRIVVKLRSVVDILDDFWWNEFALDDGDTSRTVKIESKLSRGEYYSRPSRFRKSDLVKRRNGAFPKCLWPKSLRC